MIYYSTHTRKNVINLFYTIRIQMVYWRIMSSWKKKNKSADVELTPSVCVSFTVIDHGQHQWKVCDFC